MKKSTLCLFALISACMLQVSAQTFQNIIGTPDKDEVGESMAQDADGNIVVAGTRTKGGKNYPLILTINPDGTLRRAATIESLGGTISNSVNIAAVQKANGKTDGFIIALNYSYDIILIRTNNKGVILWSKKLDANSEVPIRILPLYSPVTNYLAGFYLLASHYAQKHTLVRLSGDGDILWQKKIFHPVTSYNYFARNILPTADGGCMVVGERKEDGIWNSSVARFGPRGDLQWSRGYDFFSESDEEITAIAATPGGYILSGSNWIYNLTFQIDTVGNVLWANQYNVGFSSKPKRVVIEDNGNIVFTGSTYNNTVENSFIVKLTSAGNIVFGKGYNLNAEMNDITLTADGYFALGTADPGPFNPPDNIYLLKTDFFGNMGGNCTAQPLSIIKTPAEFINITEARLKTSNDTFKVSNIVLIPTIINDFQEEWCGTPGVTALHKTSEQPASASPASFKAYTSIAAREINVKYTLSGIADNSKYEVMLYNSSGIAVAKKPLQLNIPVTFSMAQQLPGMYMVVLLKNGSIVERQHVVWAR